MCIYMEQMTGTHIIILYIWVVKVVDIDVSQLQTSLRAEKQNTLCCLIMCISTNHGFLLWRSYPMQRMAADMPRPAGTAKTIYLTI